jgi:hypothetical protein
MSHPGANPLLDRFLRAADDVARARPEVDLETAREVFAEAATLLHDGLALDGLDDHDTEAVISGLCAALAAEDPGDAVRARAQDATARPGDLHDPDGVTAAYLVAASILQI